MAADQLDQSNILANLKQTYKNDLEDNRPIFAVLQERLSPNKDGIEVGDKLNIPVILTHQAGESYDTAGGTSTLNVPVGMQMKDAQTDQFEITEVVRMPVGMASKVQQSPKAKFADKARLLTLSGQTAAKLKLEIQLLHGSRGVAKIGAGSAATGGAGPWTRVMNIDATTWSDGYWGWAEGQLHDGYSALTAGTKRNANGVLSVDSVDFTNKTVTLRSTAAAADLTNLIAGDFLFRSGSYTKAMFGLMYYLSQANVAGVTLLGISTDFSAWRAKKVTVSGPITFGKILSGIAPAIAHGAEGKVALYANSKNAADLHKDFLATRRLDASYSEAKLKNGARKIEYVFHRVTIEMVTHDLMWDSELALIPEANWFRAGSDPDPTMNVAGKELSLVSGTTNSFEYRWFSASALIPNLLATSVYFSGVTPNPN